jgi:hypothetical protein
VGVPLRHPWRSEPCESGFRFERHAFVPGEYVSIKEQDDVMRTFRVVAVRELD